jgi:hypothetical protein
MRRSVWWFLLYGASVLSAYAYGGFRGAWRMRFPPSDSGGYYGGGGTGHGWGGGGFRGGK